MRSFRIAFAFLALALSASSAQAGLTFDFQDFGQNVNLGATKTFSAKVDANPAYNTAFQVTASGFGSVAPNTADLFAKFTNGDPTETGLGLAHGTDHEITEGSHIDFDLSKLKLAYNIQSLTFNLGSVTGHDAYEIYGLKGGAAFDLGGDTKNGPFSIKLADIRTYSNFRVTETGDDGNVLVASILVNGTAVPEPSSFALMGIAGAIGLVVRRVRKGRVA
jgi:hypothetical protein